MVVHLNLNLKQLGISRDVLNYYLDTKKPEGVKGIYLFTRPFKDIEIKSLKEISECVSLGNKVKVWVYDAKILDLINNKPFSNISIAAGYFNINYRTISWRRKNIQNKIICLFKKEINLDLKTKLLKLTLNFFNIRTKVWVYKLDEKGKL